MTDPATAIGLSAVGAYVAKDTVTKILGPTAEYLGRELQQFTERRMENIGRIFKNAAHKSGGRLDEPGSVPPRVLRDIVNDGSFHDDDLAIEYFGGMLASSRNCYAKDDRTVVFTAILTRLSQYQIRSHYIFYQAFHQLFKGIPERISEKSVRQASRVYIPLSEYERCMNLGGQSADNVRNIVEHVMFGLRDESLIHEFEYGMGFTEGAKQYGMDDVSAAQRRSGFECKLEFTDVQDGRTVQSWSEGITFAPTARGCELFLRAHGVKFLSINQITDVKIELQLEHAHKVGIGLVKAYKPSDSSWKRRDRMFTGTTLTPDLED